MSKRKRVTEQLGDVCRYHTFTIKEIQKLRLVLLKWYEKNKRDLPWRREAERQDINERAYAVWVSEIMLQQTQVSTVIDYYRKWIEKWPTVKELSTASLEEVHQVWSGLGYYSRGTRLREGAIKVEKELKGEIPKDAESLEKQLPGVGRYTAGAIASIAYGQVTGLVDGNVTRVFSRLRGIGADSTSQHVIDQIWKYANESVDKEKPGDYNQALMELGATVCTPKTPSCDQCPVKDMCVAFTRVEQEKIKSSSKLCVSKQKANNIPDIEDAAGSCKLCFDAGSPWDSSLGVCNYPRKGAKKQARTERSVVCVLFRDRMKDNKTEYFITQRPNKGLLAGLWEFPNVFLDNGGDETKKPDIKDSVLQLTGLKLEDFDYYTYDGEVVHLFSHIHQTYLIYSLKLNSTDNSVQTENTGQWVTKEELLKTAISTAMKKVFKHSKTFEDKTVVKEKQRKNPKKSDGKKQLGLDAFFKK